MRTQMPGLPGLEECPCYLGEAGVGAASTPAPCRHPPTATTADAQSWVGAVEPEATAPLSHTPAALELWVGAEAEPAGAPLRPALVQHRCQQG